MPSNQSIIVGSGMAVTAANLDIQGSTLNNVAGVQINHHYGSSYVLSPDVVPNPYHSSDPPPSQPVPPDIFLGRNALVENTVSFIIENNQSKIALLGGGGMGKTAAALHIMHHKDIASKYGDRRYFVACDATASAHAVAVLILKLLGIPLRTDENTLTTLHNAILRAPPTLLLIDNFETLWEVSTSRSGARDLLQKLTSGTSSSLLLTMRGSAPPSAISWSRIEQLSPLDRDAARDVFLAVNMPPTDTLAREGATLDILLKEMAYIPLAIRLVAQVGFRFSFGYLLDRWREERTAFLRAHEDGPDRLESVDVSISLSIQSPDLRASPEAVQLLALLCQLPDGLFRWKERLPLIASAMNNPHHLLQLLQKKALVIVNTDRVTVLSPIRHFVTVYHPAPLDHVERMENYYWDLVQEYGTTIPGPNFIESRKMLEPDINNIETLLASALDQHASSRVIEAALQISSFLYFIYPTPRILQQLKAVPREYGTPEQEAQCSHCLGDILRIQYQHGEAKSVLEDARGQFQAIGDTLGAARCSWSLGEILYLQNRYDEATLVLEDARGQFQAIGDTLGAARCSRSLGDILRMQDRYDEAKSVLEEAREQYQAIGNTLGVAQCSHCLGDILRMQHRYDEAKSVLEEARGQFQVIGDTLGAAQCSRSLGDILYSQHRYDEATLALTEAHGVFEAIGCERDASACLRVLDKISSLRS